MPMDQDPEGGGTHQDGTVSTLYCSYCFQDGIFVDDFHTPREMSHFVRQKLKDMGVGPLRRWFYTLQIPRLERWRRA